MPLRSALIFVFHCPFVHKKIKHKTKQTHTKPHACLACWSFYYYTYPPCMPHKCARDYFISISLAWFGRSDEYGVSLCVCMCVRLFPPWCLQVFREQAIDGETLPLLTEEHLLNNMGLKLGPALKIRSQVLHIAMATIVKTRGWRSICIVYIIASEHSSHFDGIIQSANKKRTIKILSQIGPSCFHCITEINVSVFGKKPCYMVTTQKK